MYNSEDSCIKEDFDMQELCDKILINGKWEIFKLCQRKANTSL